MRHYPEIGATALKILPSEEAWKALKVEAVRDIAELQKVVALRARVFMAEQDCPYDEEFDGNDLSGLHLLGYLDGEPVATLRMRWFADFGKIERVCITPAARGASVAEIMLAHAFEIGARKGFRLMTGQIQARLWPHWSRLLNCRLREDRQGFSFSNYAYLEIEIPLPPHPRGLDRSSDAFELIRPEGDWDEPGILERSTGAGTASTPSAA